MSSAALMARLAEAQAELIVVESHIQRLEEAREQFISTETELTSVCKEVNKQADQDGIWVGSNYKDYNTYTEDTFVNTDYKNYFDRLDKSIDTVTDKLVYLYDQKELLNNEIIGLNEAIAIALAEEAAAAAAAAASTKGGR